MKKKLIAILLAVAAATAGTFALVGCSGSSDGGDAGSGSNGEGEATHTCTYDKQIAEQKYLKSGATCTNKAVYYKSCVCGEMGTDTFEYGEVDSSAHIFDKQVADIEYLKSRANASKGAVYYLSCECGETGTETFEYGEKLIPTEGLEYELNVEKTEYTVIGIGTATETEIVIAAEIDGKPVTKIGALAFAEEYNAVEHILTDIVIPDSVTEIGDGAFSECDKLKNIYIPSSVTILGAAPFMACNAIESISVDKDSTAFKSVDNCLLSIDGEMLIAGCKNSVIPKGVTIICVGAFFQCLGLTDIAIPEGVITIEEMAFSQCENLNNLSIGEGVKTIGYAAFEGFNHLTCVELPSSITYIGEGAFKGCHILNRVIFNGTQEQWDAIEKGTNWCALTDYYNGENYLGDDSLTIQFSDGTDIEISNNYL